MTSIAGRISSARLLKSARAHQVKKENQIINKNVLNVSNTEKIKKQVLEVVQEEQLSVNIEVNEKANFFHVLTKEKVIEKKTNIEERKRKIEERKEKAETNVAAEGKLVDGKLFYENNIDLKDDLGEYGEIDPSLESGNPLPERFGKIKDELLHKPIVELDPQIAMTEETFNIIGKRLKKYHIYRFSSQNSFYILSPFNKIRKAMLFLSTWQYVFAGIYSIELIVKVISCGFCFGSYTYLRDPWNWLDFTLIILSYVTIIISQVSSSSSINLSSLRGFRVFRAFKTVNIIPGLKTIVSAILKSLMMFSEVLFLMVIVLAIFSIFGLQVFHGAFSNKCVLKYTSNSTNLSYPEWISNSNNWLVGTSTQEYIMCCNGTVTNYGRQCDAGYTCLQGIGLNPNQGLSHYDNFLFSMKQNFQVVSLDNWEDVMNRVVDTMGAWNILYFLPIVFIGSFYLVNLMLAVVSLAYNIEVENERKKLDFVKPKKNATIFDLETIRAKIAETERLKEEKKNAMKFDNKEKKIEATKGIVKNNISTLQQNSKQTGLSNSLGGILERDDNETAAIGSIKLSEKMGKYNNLVDEGKSACHYHGGDLVTDERGCYCCLKLGKYFLTWIKIQNFFFKIVTSAYFELLIAICIIINTLIMSIQYYDQPSEMDNFQDYSNYIISSIFMIECIMKVIAYGKRFFYDFFNWFDLFIVTMSIVDWATPNIKELSMFRAFRLLRIFKLAKTWKTMRKIFVIMTNSFSQLSYLVLVLFIVIYVFALIGYNLFSESYIENYSTLEMPRFNFTDIIHSILMIFRVLCGECYEPMHECWLVAGPTCVALFYPTVLLGNFLMLNLFMAMLLDAFDAISMKTNKNKDDEEEDKISKLLKEIKEKIITKCLEPMKERIRKVTNGRILDETKDFSELNETEKSNLDEDDSKIELIDCLPSFFYRKVCHFTTLDTKFNKNWSRFRALNLKLIEHKVFEGFIIFCILASSLLLAFEDVYLKKNSDAELVIQGIDYFFQAVFLIEMLLKWIGYGLKKYFTDWWCLLDSLIVLVSIINLGLTVSNSGTSLGFLKVLRTLRALRPLRAISKYDGMKIVINALGNSIPAIFDVAAVCLVFWLIFAIIGVMIFRGKFFNCVDATSGSVINSVHNKSECLSLNSTQWYNSKINFDNVAIGYLALLQLATFEGWRDIINAGVDSIDVGVQPQRESNMYNYLFFVVFIFFGSFFTLNLFVGVIIDNFNALKKKYEGGVMQIFLTPSQKAYLKTIKSIGKKKPKKSVKRPESLIRGIIYDSVTSTKFDVIMTIVIILNMISLTIEFYGQPTYFENIYNLINTVFVTIFSAENIFKLVAMRHHFFRSIWNVFDFLVTIACLIALPLEQYVVRVMVNPLLFYTIRIFRLLRSLRFVKATKGIRKLIRALLISLPALLNIAALLFLIIFIYAIIGMSLFMNVKLQNSFTSNNNFQTFGKSFILLFRAGTISGWNEVLNALMLSNGDPGSNCTDSFDIQSYPSSYDTNLVNGCGNTGFAIFYMVSYVLIVRMVMINMYIAVILENYDEAHEQEEIGITEDDFENFYQVWEKYDPYATQFIKLDKIYNFVAELSPPLGVPFPNDMAITSFSLPIIKGDLIHCLDALHGLTSYALGSVESSKEFNEVQKQMDDQFLSHFPVRVKHAPVTTTMERKKLEIAARTLQRAWKSFKIQKSLRQHAKNFIHENEQNKSLIPIQ